MEHCQNHQHCIDDALSNAKHICRQQGARLTDLRQQVLLLIWQSHRPLGAYALMDMLADSAGRRVAPPTVYRALEFLLALGLVHRINSLNAFIGCRKPHSHQQPQQPAHYFMICHQCHNAWEVFDEELSNRISTSSEKAGFQAEQQWLEVSGLCESCRTP